MSITFWKRQYYREKYEIKWLFSGRSRQSILLQIFNGGNFEGGKITSLYHDCESVTVCPCVKTHGTVHQRDDKGN